MNVERKNTEENIEKYYAKISQLTTSAINGKPDQQRKAYRDLMKELTSSPYFDPIFPVAEKGLEIARNEKNPTRLTNELITLSRLFTETTNDTQDKGGKRARINKINVRFLENIVTYDDEIFNLPKYKFLKSQIEENKFISAAYDTVVGTIRYAEKRARQRSNGFLVSFTDPDEDPEITEQRKTEDRAHSDWWYELKEPLNNLIEDNTDGIQKDRIIDFLKTEPSRPVRKINSLFKTKFGSISMADVEKMPSPLNSQDTKYCLEYLREMFGSKSHDDTDKLLAFVVTMTPSYVIDEKGNPLPLKNQRLINNCNDVQETILNQLLYSENPNVTDVVKKLLAVSPDDMFHVLTNCLVQYSTIPERCNINSQSLDPDEFLKYHQFADDAIAWHADQQKSFVFSDEAKLEYLKQALFPRLEKRAREFGFWDKFEPYVREFQKKLESRTFDQIHTEAMRKFFKENCGTEFLDKLNQKKNDIETISHSAWQSIEKQGLHFLPMMNGVNTITFSEGSVPEIIGLKSIKFHTIGSLDNWQINIAYKLNEQNSAMIGHMDDQGKIHLRADLENIMPGIVTILNHIAVLAFRDLTNQERQESVADTRDRVEKPHEKVISKDKENNQDTSGQDYYRSTKQPYRSLPRIQKDSELIANVSRNAEIKPHPVELHPSWVRGGKEYAQAIKNYNETIQMQVSETDLYLIIQDLKNARDKSFKASEHKISTIPKRYEPKRVHVIDPVTKEERDLVTWVKEHVSPKPTSEEEQNPVLMFERYYAKSSALASLEQLKGWFFGV